MIMTAFTLFHVAISLIGIVSGFVALAGLLRGKLLPSWTATFLSTTVATSMTGFLFPSHHFTAAHAIGIISLIGLAVALIALYPRQLRGSWRTAYVVSAVLSLYLNTFVAVVQGFQKIPIVKAAAPTQTELPFILSQLALMIVFVVLGRRAWIRFRVPAVDTARDTEVAPVSKDHYTREDELMERTEA